MLLEQILTRRPRARLQPVATPTVAAFRQALPWLLLSLMMTLLALAGQVPWWVLFVFAACILWRYVLARTGGPLPSMSVRVLLFLPVAACIVMTYRQNPGASGMLTFLIALLSLKILELRSARDFSVVALLGYFMVLSGFFYDQSLLLCVYLAVALLINTAALVRCHSGGQRELWPTVRLTLGMTAQTLPLVVLLFVIFPRLQGHFLRRFTGGNTGMTGMSGDLHPGSFSALAQSDEPAFRAEINNGVTLPQRELYWRGLVLDVCVASMSWQANANVSATNGGVPPAGPGSRRVKERITQYVHGEKWMYALDRPVGVEKYSSGLRPQLTTSDELENQESNYSNVMYTAVSELNPVSPPELTPDRRLHYTHLPAGVSEAVKKLARSWRPASRPGDPPAQQELAVIHAAQQFFREGGFTYTLNPGLLPTRGALDAFLFGSRRGFCEHYAAAFCALMRAADVPARIVLGYQGGEFNDWSKYYLVRQSDAHAWAEVWVTGKGWQREDPTAVVAPERVSFGAENYASMSADGSLSAEARLARLNALNTRGSFRWLQHQVLLAWDGADQQWNSFVLGYDQDKQLTVLQRLGVDRLSWLGSSTLTLATVFALLVLVTAVMRAFNRGDAAPDDPLRRLYARFCNRVAHAGDVQRGESEGPLDFARRAAAMLPGEAAAIQSITDLYVAARYAPAEKESGRAAFAALRGAVNRFRPKRAGS